MKPPLTTLGNTRTPFAFSASSLVQGYLAASFFTAEFTLRSISEALAAVAGLTFIKFVAPNATTIKPINKHLEVRIISPFLPKKDS